MGSSYQLYSDQQSLNKNSAFISNSVGALLFMCLSCCNVWAQKQAAILKPGIVVDSLLPSFGGEKAGLRPGDVLLSWSRGDNQGKIECPLDLVYLNIEEASRGTVQLKGLRRGNKRTWRLGSNYWVIDAHPRFQGQLLSFYQQEYALVDASKLTEAVEQWRRLSAERPEYRIPSLGPWLISHLADVSRNRSWDGIDDAYREAIREADAAGPIVKAQLLKQWARYFQDRDDLSSAANHYEEAISEYRKLGNRTLSIAFALRLAGGIAHSQGDIAKAGEYFRESSRIAEELAPHSMLMATDLIWLGAVSQARGDLGGAEESFRKALVIEKEAVPGSQDIGLILKDLGNIASRRGDQAKAEIYFRKALFDSKKFGSGSLYLPDILSRLAECLLDQGNAAMAEVYEKRALAIRQKRAASSLPVASSLRNLGDIARFRGDLPRAQEYYEQALATGRTIAPESADVVRILIDLGYIERDRGNPVQAEIYLRQALAILEDKAPGSQDHAEALADLAGIVYREKNVKAAIDLYQQALDELSNETSQLGGVEEDQAHYRALHDQYYREYVGLLCEDGRSDFAFETLEASRSRTLLEVLSRSQIDIRQGVDPASVARQHEFHELLNAKLQYRIQLLSEKHTEQQVSVLDREIADLREGYDAAKAETRASNPAYAALTQPQRLTVRDIQQLLNPDTVLLEYSLGEERSHVWVLTEHSLEVHELPVRAQIENLARTAYQLLNARNLIRQRESDLERQARLRRTDREFARTSTKLSEMILGPVAASLGKKRLVIVADGALQYIPFAALPVPEPAAQPLVIATWRDSQLSRSTTPPLVLEHEIVSLPSASILAELRRREDLRIKPPKAVAVFADPVFDDQDIRVLHRAGLSDRPLEETAASWRLLTRSVTEIGKSGGTVLHLTRLPATRKEAAAIVAGISTAKRLEALDFRASRATALNASLAQYRIVHFATHGLVNSVHPELSGLVLSLVDAQGRRQHGFLDLQDVYNLNLPVDLVVLSGCQTGLGQEISGEGLIGLTRGFMYAGASRVVTSLWSVNDTATGEFMARFYKAMQRDNLQPAAALRSAQVQMWKQKIWQSPYYWAAFQIQGDWR